MLGDVRLSGGYPARAVVVQQASTGHNVLQSCLCLCALSLSNSMFWLLSPCMAVQAIER